MEFYKVTDIDFSQLAFSKTKNSSGKRFINAYYNKKILGLKFPPLKIPFDSKINMYDQLEINVSLGINEDLIESVKNLDEEMVKFADENKWFKDENYKYTPTLKESSNGDFPPTIKMKIPVNNGVVKTTFFDENKKKINISTRNDVVNLMKKATVIQTAIECVGVWFIGEKFGLAWKAEQIRIISKPEQFNREEEYGFCSSSSDDDKSDTELLIED